MKYLCFGMLFLTAPLLSKEKIWNLPSPQIYNKMINVEYHLNELHYMIKVLEENPKCLPYMIISLRIKVQKIQELLNISEIIQYDEEEEEEFI